MSATAEKTSKTSRRHITIDNQRQYASGSNNARPSYAAPPKVESAEHTFSLYAAARQFIADAELDTATVEELADQFAQSLSMSDLRAGIASVSRALIRNAIRQQTDSRTRSLAKPPKPGFDDPNKPTLGQQIKDTYVYLPDGRIMSLADMSQQDCYLMRDQRYAVADATRAKGDKWGLLGDTIVEKHRQTVGGVRADLVLEILGPDLGSENDG